ncbi:unnamed protein product [Chilo suppressalis]|uniref:Chemosensory protein n=1 Tax=Chilo suppressalis TaxID=168631 RepID=A0ABN8B0T2_CHISP|nr:hypothetical protein evm_002578 [Chilo suppressalis]CAH0401228.1 unnamed protein product [Chilo suppressalis]
MIMALTLVAGEFYDAKYDDFDIEPLLENDRILQGYTKCFLDEGPCTPEAKDFKKVIPEALETSCGKCSPKQRILIKKVIRAMMEKHPDSWNKLVDKYDKDKKFRATFNKFIEEED